MTVAELLAEIQKVCPPGIWSKGVALSRTDSLIQDSQTEDEIVVRVKSMDHPVSRRVNLWPGDEDWFCDCGSTLRVCPHVAAVVIWIKTGGAQSHRPSQNAVWVEYRFSRNAGNLSLERWIRHSDGREERLSLSLVAFMGGMSSGRIPTIPLSATQLDFAVDQILGSARGNASGSAWGSVLNSQTLSRLFAALAESSQVYLDGKKVSVLAKPLGSKVRITDESEKIRVSLVGLSEGEAEYFGNGAVLADGALRSAGATELTQMEKTLLAEPGTLLSMDEARVFASRVLPELEKKIQIEITSKRLPKPVRVSPRIILELTRLEGTESVSVLPRLVYGPLVGGPLVGGPLVGGNDELARSKTEVAIFDSAAEKTLARKLQNELQLSIGQRVSFQGEGAAQFVRRARNWEISGSGNREFSIQNDLCPKILFTDENFEISFETGQGGAKADTGRVLQAWRENQSYVPLLGGEGWAALPKDWMERFGDQVHALLMAKAQSEKPAKHLLLQATHLCEQLGQPIPQTLAKLRGLLDSTDTIEDAKLPQGLQASLRSYQQKGVNWLTCLRKAELGAMLADDMGLGKTLQTLCVIQGRTLVVCPTSVLRSWVEQLLQFRPGVKYSVFHGSDRELKPNADGDTDVVLTTYGLLRLDQKTLTQTVWDTVILDEAQTIRNPQSQVAQAAHRLQAKFRIALSGTPIENRLDDLWSQFQFLNPGLLGTHEDFEDHFTSRISKGDSASATELRKRIKPFILRRLKTDVAPELPPRTEKVLYCELGTEEQNLYQAILASTRKEVVEKLEKGSSVFAALELLLRLRQACCHPALVPGGLSEKGSLKSSKLDLLVQTLESSIALGHRALVFSQWTSYLDLIETALTSAGIRYSRLDGSTRDRGQVVQDFQSPDGPPVMLISLKAGGVGLTLTAADHVFLMDPWWNPAVENQAADRTHRIGQTQPVLIHRLIAQGTVEDRVLELQKSKSALASAVLSGDGTGLSSGGLSQEDILELLR